METKAEADARKAAADADAAEAAARKAAREEAEARSLAARQARAAERTKALAEAGTATATARRGQLAAFVPDLSTVDLGSTTVSGTSAMYESLLVARALAAAGDSLAGAVTHQDVALVLVTTEVELAAAVASHDRVVDVLERLHAAADEIFGAPADQAPEDGLEDMGAGAVIGAAISAVPSIMNMLGSNTTVSTTSPTSTALVTSMAVCAAFARREGPKPTVMHDSFRVPRSGRLRSRLAELVTKREQLSAIPPSDGRAERAEALADRIDAWFTAVDTAGEGTRSALTTAVLHETLLATERGAAVLLVQPAVATVSQTVRDKKVGDDRVGVAASVVIPWLLVSANDDRVIAGGHSEGKRDLQYEVGEFPRFS